MTHNEDTRVKIPAILHLYRLGYDYISLHSKPKINEYNIFTDVFKKSISKINPNVEEYEIDRLLVDLTSKLDYEDLGKAFYKYLMNQSGIKLIDFDNFDNNNFNVVTELPYANGEENFRPDIIVLINGLPLFFIEVKKPNNKEGIIAERNRINRRFQNPKFRRFVNITQLMVFSNNMPYHDDDLEPLQGAYYATTSYKKPMFNYFREQEVLNLDEILKPIDEDVENFVLKDNNHQTLKSSTEFETNKEPTTPTNRILTSLFCKERISFILNYALAYVKKEDASIQKHVMRYPQLFATKAIAKKLDFGWDKGIIWHTQGSGKTALAYFNVKFLTDYYKKQQITPQFYFVVDRLDLLTQAIKEFKARGLRVFTVNSRSKFIEAVQKTEAIHNDKGEPEITVVNIQKFSSDARSIASSYDVKTKKIFFLDEVHRGYKPDGCFLSNLMQLDRNSIKIGLTGTPIISKDYKTIDIFGGYIHTYYYNESINDGYTLKLIREEISNDYKIQLGDVLDKLQLQKGTLTKNEVFAHPNYVTPMLHYIINDLRKFRVANSDDSLCGMVVCDSSAQAKEMFRLFNEIYVNHTNSVQENVSNYNLISEDSPSYLKSLHKFGINKGALILYDVGTKDDRKAWIEDFKSSKIDILFVYDMLLTGFDAHNLKKLYLGRVIRNHGLLQALTRVNRTYNDYHYGYVVDFADIRSEFDKTNKAYFDELQNELGDEFKNYSKIFKSKEEIEEEISEIKNNLFDYDLTNAENFNTQISAIDDREIALKIKTSLVRSKELLNIINLYEHNELLDKMDFNKIPSLLKEINLRIEFINTSKALKDGINNDHLINLALEDVIFHFKKTGENELVLADSFRDKLRKTRQEFQNNFDKKDPEYITLQEELIRIFKKKNMNEISQEEMVENIDYINKVYDKIKELNRKDNLIKSKYNGDIKFTRIYKRLLEQETIGKAKQTICAVLLDIKDKADTMVIQNSNILDSTSYFEKEMMSIVIDQLMKKNKIKLTTSSSKYINGLVVNEYMNEYKGITEW